MGLWGLTRGRYDIFICISGHYLPRAGWQGSWEPVLGLPGDDENWTRPSFYNVPRALDVIRGGRKGPKTTLSWSCFVSVAIVVFKSLCGQDCREKAKGVTFLQSHAVSLLSGGFRGVRQTSPTPGISQSNLEADRGPISPCPLPCPAEPLTLGHVSRKESP